MNWEKFGMSLTLYCQLEFVEEAGRGNTPAAPIDLAPGTALGSLSSVALSSAQATASIPQMYSTKSDYPGARI